MVGPLYWGPTVFIAGGVPLALKHGSSNGVDVVDVKYVLAAFQEINKCQLVVSITAQGSAARPELALEISAYDDLTEPAVPVLLASQKSIVGSMGPRTMEAAIRQGLYALDAQLAEKEFVKGHSR